MSDKKIIEPKWLIEPENHDYPAAESYLNLIFGPYSKQSPQLIVIALQKAPMTSFKAKDIFRASELSLLGISKLHVKKNIKKIKNGIALSPLLLVRDRDFGKVIVADGYHRMCAVYQFNEDVNIPCKIV